MTTDPTTPGGGWLDPPSPQQSKLRNPAAVVLAGMAAVAAVGVGSHLLRAGEGGAGASDTATITGTLTLARGGWNGYPGDGKSCYGYDGYGDLRRGAQVTVRDGAGRVVALSSLRPGFQQAGSCVFKFKVPDVPMADFYAVEVSHRGEVRYTHDQLVAAGYVVSLTLG